MLQTEVMKTEYGSEGGLPGESGTFVYTELKGRVEEPNTVELTALVIVGEVIVLTQKGGGWLHNERQLRP